MQVALPADVKLRGSVIVAFKRAIIDTRFSEAKWKELGYLTSTRDWIVNHSRLFRSLQWSDPDYDGHVLDTLEHILQQDQNNIQVMFDFGNLGTWVQQHAPDAYAAAIEAGASQAQTAPDAAVKVESIARERPYDVALSFAGEDRAHAEALATQLIARGVKVFYDSYEEANLWGKDLYTHLNDVYQHQAKYCAMFLSGHYAKKAWTNHERGAAQARAFTESQEYILPIRLDETNIPGILPTTGYLACPPATTETITAAILYKLDHLSSRGTLSRTRSTPVEASLPQSNLHFSLPTEDMWLRTQAHVFTHRVVYDTRYPPFFMVGMRPATPIPLITPADAGDSIFRRVCSELFGPEDASSTEPNGIVFDPVAAGYIGENEHPPYACAFLDGSIGVRDSVSFTSFWQGGRPVPLGIDLVGLWRLLRRALQTMAAWPRDVGHATGPLDVRLSLGNLEQTFIRYPSPPVVPVMVRSVNRSPVWDSSVVHWIPEQDIDDLLDTLFSSLSRQLQFGAYSSCRTAIRAEASD